MAETFHRFNDRVYLMCIWVSGIAIAVMSLIIPWGIFTRYVLGTGSQWPEPIAIQLMVMFTFLGAAVAYRAGSHIAVAMVTDRLPEMLRHVLRGVVHLCMLAVAIFTVVKGTRLCLETWNQVIGQLPWLRVGVTYMPVPIGGLVTALFVLEVIFFGNQNQRAVITFDHLIEDTGAAQ
jgi:TRAP-type C4-dicarboxylate transport system permease small subunit